MPHYLRPRAAASGRRARKRLGWAGSGKAICYRLLLQWALIREDCATPLGLRPWGSTLQAGALMQHGRPSDGGDDAIEHIATTSNCQRAWDLVSPRTSRRQSTAILSSTRCSLQHQASVRPGYLSAAHVCCTIRAARRRPRAWSLGRPERRRRARGNRADGDGWRDWRHTQANERSLSRRWRSFFGPLQRLHRAPQPAQRVLREDCATTSRAASRGRRPENRSRLSNVQGPIRR